METLDTRPVTKEAEAERIVNGYMGWSAGAGLIPVPLADLAAIGAVQLKMLERLANLYGVEFKTNVVKSLIGALIGSSGSVMLAVPAASLLKIVPVVGHLAALFTEPAMAAAATYALGKVFIQHFESGGTFLDFNPESVRKHYEEQLAAARTGTAARPAAATPAPAKAT
jgi:uncharacterized protein (DUF697 family)